MAANNTFGYEYDIKCRSCGKITRMSFGLGTNVSKRAFKTWVEEHSTFPIHKQCSCDNGMILLHDLIAYGNILKL